MKPLTLVLLPGLDGTEVFFRPLLAALPEQFETITLSYPDQGPGEYERLLALVRERLQSVPSCLVLAASFSGPLAVMLAAAEPNKVRGLILCATFLRTPRRYPAAMRLIANAPTVLALRTLRRLPVWLLRGSVDPLRQAKRETWQRVSAQGLARRAQSLLAVDVRDILRGCVQPVLSVGYADDRVVAPRYSEEIGEHANRVRHVTLPGGHLGMFSDPAALASELQRFADELELAKS